MLRCALGIIVNISYSNHIKINDELKPQVILENSINNNDRKFMTLYEVVTIFQGYRFSPFP